MAPRLSGRSFAGGAPSRSSTLPCPTLKALLVQTWRARWVREQAKGMSELFAETRSETRARKAAVMQLADDFTAHRASTDHRFAGV